MGDPIADINSPSPPPIAPLSGRNWLILVLIAIFGLYCGIHVIVTKKASAGPGFHGGPAQLTTSQAWFMGAAYIFGGAVLPYGYLVVRRKQLAQRAAQDAQKAAELVAEGMTPSEATEQIAADRGEKRHAQARPPLHRHRQRLDACGIRRRHRRAPADAQYLVCDGRSGRGPHRQILLLLAGSSLPGDRSPQLQRRGLNEWNNRAPLWGRG